MKKAVAALLALTVFLSLFSAFSVFSAAAWDESEIFTSGDGCWQYYLREEDDKAVIMGTVEEPGETVTIPAEIDGHKVAAVGERAFLFCSSIKKVVVAEGITEIGNDAFAECSSVTEVSLPNGIVALGEGAFFRCSSLMSLTLPESLVSVGDEAFSSCSALKNINFPSVLENIGRSAFSNCSSLTSVTLPQGLKTLGRYVFGNCTNLERADLSATKLTELSDSMFSRCKSLKNVALPSGLTKIGGNVFYLCDGLTDVNIPNGVAEIGKEAFYNCSLKSLTLPSGLKTIGDGEFYQCWAIPFVNLPQGVVSVGAEAFANCQHISGVTVPNSVTDIGKNAFGGDFSLKAMFGVRGSSAENYAKANGIPFVAYSEYYDTATGVRVFAEVGAGAKLKVSMLKQNEASVFYEISFVKNGVEVKPQGAVRVFLPVPASINADGARFRRVDENRDVIDLYSTLCNGGFEVGCDALGEFRITDKNAEYVGDVDGSGRVDITDAMLLFYHVAKKEFLAEDRLPYAEVTDDLEVDISDAMAVFYYVAKKSDTLVIGGRDKALEIFENVNYERVRYGSKPLQWDEKLYKPSVIRSEEYVRWWIDGYGAGPHKRPDGRDCFTAIYENTDYKQGDFRTEGENCAGAGTENSGEFMVLHLWMQSKKGHRENLLDSIYTRMAVGFYDYNGFAGSSNLFAAKWGE